jgi:hypothetical protein
MRTREQIVAKLAKWYLRAEEATTRSEAAKVLRKIKKHAKRLAKLDMASDN